MMNVRVKKEVQKRQAVSAFRLSPRDPRGTRLDERV